MKLLKYFRLTAYLFVMLAACTQHDPNNGLQEEFYPNGIIKSTFTLKNGLRNGTVKYFDTKGRLLSKAEYKDNLKNGELINYNSENGKMILKAHFKEDIQHGKVIQYYREGMLFRESNYVNGRVEGLVKTYWPKGNLKAENFFHQGKPAIGLKEFDKESNLINQPQLMVRKSNARKFGIEIQLSSDVDEVEYYINELEEGKYFHPKSKRLRTEGSKAYYDYSVIKNSYQIKKISIIAKAKTKYGNTLILQKYFNI